MDVTWVFAPFLHLFQMTKQAIPVLPPQLGCFLSVQVPQAVISYYAIDHYHLSDIFSERGLNLQMVSASQTISAWTDLWNLECQMPLTIDFHYN